MLTPACSETFPCLSIEYPVGTVFEAASGDTRYVVRESNPRTTIVAVTCKGFQCPPDGFGMTNPRAPFRTDHIGAMLADGRWQRL